VTWGDSNGSWTDPTAWVPTGVPTASDDALATSGAVTIQNGSGACASLGISNTAILDVNNSGNSLNVTNNAMVSGKCAITMHPGDDITAGAVFEKETHTIPAQPTN